MRTSTLVAIAASLAIPTVVLTSPNLYAGDTAVPPEFRALAAKAAEPTAKELERANANVAFDTDHTATHKLPADQGEVKFVPAKLGDMNDAEKAKGVIIGKLVTPHKTPEGLDPDTYRVYLCKEGGEWQVYYIKDTNVIKKVPTAHHADNAHEPNFVDATKRIRYWEVSFAW